MFDPYLDLILLQGFFSFSSQIAAERGFYTILNLSFLLPCSIPLLIHSLEDHEFSIHTLFKIHQIKCQYFYMVYAYAFCIFIQTCSIKNYFHFLSSLFQVLAPFPLKFSHMLTILKIQLIFRLESNGKKIYFFYFMKAKNEVKNRWKWKWTLKNERRNRGWTGREMKAVNRKKLEGKGSLEGKRDLLYVFVVKLAQLALYWTWS